MTAPDLFIDEPEWREITDPEGKRIRWREVPGDHDRFDVGLEIQLWEPSYGWMPLNAWVARWFWLGLRAGGGE